LIYNSTAYSNQKNWCWHHPQVRENWRVVLAAVILLIIGTGNYLYMTYNRIKLGWEYPKNSNKNNSCFIIII
jgi:hypothetical protein